MITIDLSILNQKGTPMFYSDVFAARPPFGIAGRIFISTDTKEFYRDTGTAWELLGGPGTGTITGGGTATQVAFFNSATSIAGNNDLYWDNVNSRLGIGNNNPAVNLDIHGNNATIQIDGRSTSSAFVQFVTQGVTKWRIGNLSPSNYFQIYDNANSLERLKIENTGLFTLTGNVNNNATKTAVSNDGWYGLYTNEVVSIPASTTFTGGNSFGSITGNNSMTFAGNATMPNGAVPAGILSSNVFNFSNALTTLTITQATGTRAISAVTAFNQVNTIFGSTITHLAGFQVLAPYSQNGTLTATNYFGLLINASNERAGFTITNAWGIYQEGSSDRNYLNGTTLIGTNVDNLSGAKLQVSGAATFTSSGAFPLTLTRSSNSWALALDGSGGFSIYDKTALADRLYISSTGNLGLGVTPSAWTAFNPVLQVKTGSLAGSGTANFRMFANTYYDGSYKYIGTGTATQYEQDGYHAWYTAPSGSANAAITFTERMRLDVSGNLGLGVTPSAWSTFTAMQIKNASFSGQGNFAYMGANYYYDGTNNRYIASDFASRYQQFNGIHQWLTASSGTAGNIITFSSAMTLDASGNLFIGATSGSNTAGFTNRLYLEGNVPSLTLSNTGTNTGKFTFGVTNGNLGIWNNATSSYPLFINSSNNVGIGTANPSSGISSTETTLQIENSNLAALSLNNTASRKYTIYSGVSGQLAFYDVTAGAERMRISSGGRVLIGTTTDNATGTLQVTGASTFSSDLYLNDSGHFIFYTGTFIPQCGMFTSGTDLVFFTGTFAEAFRVVSTGIQTQAPTASSAVPWKLGNVSVVSPTSPNRTIAVEVNGTTYYIHAKTTNN